MDKYELKWLLSHLPRFENLLMKFKEAVAEELLLESVS